MTVTRVIQKNKLGPYVRLLLPNNKDKATRVFITGRSKSGKTHLAVSIMAQYFIERVERFFVICPSFFSQKTFEPIRDFTDDSDVYTERPTDETFEKIRDQILEDLKEDENKMFLLFIDDVSSDNVTNIGRKGIFASLSTEAPHINLSIIALFQQAKACSAAFRNNADDIIIFPPADKDAVKCFEEEFNPFIYDKKRSKDYFQIVSKIWNEGNFIFIHRVAREETKTFKNFDVQIFV